MAGLAAEQVFPLAGGRAPVRWRQFRFINLPPGSLQRAVKASQLGQSLVMGEQAQQVAVAAAWAALRLTVPVLAAMAAPTSAAIQVGQVALPVTQGVTARRVTRQHHTHNRGVLVVVAQATQLQQATRAVTAATTAVVVEVALTALIQLTIQAQAAPAQAAG